MSAFSTSTKDPTTAESVRVLHTTTVHCAYADAAFPNTAIPLGPIEGLVAAVVPIAISFIYRYPGTADGADATDFVNADDVQRALSHLLVAYPVLSGRLVLVPNGDRLVDRLDSGVTFATAECTQSLRELHDANLRKSQSSSSSGGGRRDERTARRFADVLSLFDLPAGSNALFAPYDASPHGIVNDPLLSVQHTRFACGSVGLGVRVSHALTDAQGFFQMFGHLMELYGKLRSGETCPQLVRPPRWRSYLCDFRDTASPDELAAALAYTPTGLYLDDTAPIQSPTEKGGEEERAAPAVTPTAQPEVAGRELYFTAEELAELKERATPPDGTAWVSTFEALNAFLWQTVYRARCAVREVGCASAATAWPPTDFLTSVNLRRCFVEPATAAAADDYFPVGCFAPVTTTAPAVLRDAPLHVVAAELHALLRSPALSLPEVRQTARWVAAQPDRTRVRGPFSPSGFAISAWNKFDLYGAAACGGLTPLLVSTPFTNISLMDALGYILPYPPAFSEEGGATASPTDGVVVYLAADASLWAVLRAKDMLGPHLH